MVTTISIRNVEAIICCDAIVDSIDQGAGAGFLRIYDATGGVPTNVDTAITTQVLLAELLMTDPAFGAAVDIAPGARATAGTINDDASANATGTAAFFRFEDSVSVDVIQGTVGTAGEVLNLNTVSIVSGARVSVSAFTITVPES